MSARTQLSALETRHVQTRLETTAVTATMATNSPDLFALVSLYEIQIVSYRLYVRNLGVSRQQLTKHIFLRTLLAMLERSNDTERSTMFDTFTFLFNEYLSLPVKYISKLVYYTTRHRLQVI